MSKIDCDVTTNFLREKLRMCNSYADACGVCPLRKASINAGFACAPYVFSFPDRAVEIVQEWSDEHPQKTRLDDLKEKYPKYKFYGSDQCPSAHPAIFGYCDTCTECINKKQTLRYCWNEPVDGGATGKAVE